MGIQPSNNHEHKDSLPIAPSSIHKKDEQKKVGFGSRIYQALTNNWITNKLYFLAKNVFEFFSINKKSSAENNELVNKSIKRIPPSEAEKVQGSPNISKNVSFSTSPPVVHKYLKEMLETPSKNPSVPSKSTMTSRTSEENSKEKTSQEEEESKPGDLNQLYLLGDSSVSSSVSTPLSSLLSSDRAIEKQVGEAESFDINSSMYASWMEYPSHIEEGNKVLENNILLKSVSPEDFKEYNKILEEIHKNAKEVPLDESFVVVEHPLNISFVDVKDEVAEKLSLFFFTESQDEKDTIKNTFKEMFIYHSDRNDQSKLVPDPLNVDIEILIQNEVIKVKDQFYLDSDRFGSLTFNGEKLFELKIDQKSKEEVCSLLLNRIGDKTVFNRLGVLMHQSMTVDFLKEIHFFRMDNGLLFSDDVNSPWNQFLIQGAQPQFTIDENTGEIIKRLGGQDIALVIDNDQVTIDFKMPYQLAHINKNGDKVSKGYACIERRLTFSLSDLKQDWGVSPTTTENILPSLQVYQRVTSIKGTLGEALNELEKPFREVDPKTIRIDY